MPKINTILLDCSGVILDDLDACYNTNMNILKVLGKQPVSKKVFVENILPVENLFNLCGIELGNVKNIYQLFLKYFHQNEHLVMPFPEVKEILENLKSNGITLGIVTSYPTGLIKELLLRFGLIEYFDTIVGYEDARSKPSPEPVLKAIERLEANRDSTIFVGDMEADIIAGKTAGIKTIAISRKNGSYHTREMLERSKPFMVINELTELLKIIE
jgi:HAD superfamily hydrolase (TIGR01549 family)